MIYEPQEDSYLLSRVLKKYAKNKRVLDMGAGSGIQSETARSAGARSILAVDIDPESLAFMVKKQIPVIKSDLFRSVKGTFDLIVCNPPYLPYDSREDAESQRITTGGKQGDEFVLSFLKQVTKHLAPKANILLLISSLTPYDRIKKALTKNKLRARVIAKERVFMEELKILKIGRR